MGNSNTKQPVILNRMKILLFFLTGFMLLTLGCQSNSSKNKSAVQELIVAENAEDGESKLKPQRLTSEELYSAFNDSINALFLEAIGMVNLKTGEFEGSAEDLVWSSNKYPDLFWYKSDFELSVKKEQIGNRIYYLTSCLIEGSEINIFGYIILEYQTSNYILKDTCFNIISEDYFNDTWTFDYNLTYSQDSLPIAVFKVGQGEETIAYRETIALFDILKRKLIGDNITTRELFDGMDENDGYKWDSETLFIDTSFVNGYPDFVIKTKGTYPVNTTVVDYNIEIPYQYDTELKRYKKVK